jgi:GNAT superfamily N-acetyltransferase
MEKELTFRLATEADLEKIVEIAIAAYSAIYDSIHDQLGDELFDLCIGDPKQARREQAIYNISTNTCYVSEIDGEIVGFIHFMYDEARKLGMLSNNAVNPAYRGRGIGGKQYEFVFDLLRKMGAVAVSVTTGLDEGHAPARRAYEKAGFEKNTKSITYRMLL